MSSPDDAQTVPRPRDNAGLLADGNPRYLTVAEVAAIMRTSKMTVYRLVHSGELEKAIRIGRSFRIPAPSVIAYLADAVVVPDEPAP